MLLVCGHVISALALHKLPTRVGGRYVVSPGFSEAQSFFFKKQKPLTDLNVPTAQLNKSLHKRARYIFKPATLEMYRRVTHIDNSILHERATAITIC